MKKNYCFVWERKIPGLIKFIRIMKLTFFMLMISTVCVLANKSYSQTKMLNLKMNRTEVKEVLSRIEEQSEFYFMYSEKIIDVNREVSVNAENQKIETVLNSLFEGTSVEYTIKDRIIVLTTPEVFGKTFQVNLRPGTINGKVTDTNGQSLPGVTVVLKGTTKGTVTNANGEFSLTDIPENAILQFTFVGMKSKEIPLEGKNDFIVILEGDIIGLDEVVAIGYGTAKKQDLTGSIVNVKTEELMKYQPGNVAELLRSSAAGVKVGYSFDAKATPFIQIRGDNTIKSDANADIEGNKPLIVIDGVIFNGDLSEINVHDIASVDVLKDASAASIYGSRAANGVVVFTTNKGNSAQPTIRFNAKYGIVTSAKRIKTYDGTEVMHWLEEMNESINSKLLDEWSKWTPYNEVPAQYKNDWLNENNIPGETDMGKITNVWLDNFGFEQNEKENYLAGKSYDWQNWLFQTGQRQDYNFNISGKGEKVTYYWSLGYKNNESVQVGDEFSMISSRLNLDVSLANFLNVGLNTQFSYQDEGQQPIPNGAYSTKSPYDTPWENGMPQTKEHLKVYSAGSNMANPLLDPAYIDRKFDSYRLFPTMYAKLKLPFGITYTSNFTQRLEFGRRFQFNDVANPVWSSGGEDEGVSRTHNQVYEWQFDNIINWSKEFGEHQIDVTGLINAERNQNWETSAFTNEFSPTNILGYHYMSFGLQPRTDAYDEANSRTALLGRVNYSFHSRYYLSASVRQDGYSRFGENQLHATFPSVSAGWTLSQENFMSTTSNWLSFLKLRASWGVNGNSSGIGSYAAYARLADGKYLNYNNGYYPVTYLYLERMANSDLAWEKIQGQNIGLDYGFWDGRLRGSLDLYSSNTNDLLLDKKLPIVSGFNIITANVGKLKNKGFDLSINSVNVENESFKWTSGLNISYNKNEIVSLTGEKNQVIDASGNPVFDDKGNPLMKEPDDIDNGWFIGQNKDVIWDYEVDGVYQLGDEEEAAKYNFYPGDFRVVDQNNDGKLNSADKIFQGTSVPPWYLTFRNELTYKGFDIGIVLLSKLGYKGGTTLPFNNNTFYIKNHNWYKIPYWTPDNPTNDYARINSLQLSEMGIWNSKSYVRFQNFSLGYNLSNTLLDVVNFGSARVAFNIDNVGVLTKWKIGDPESDTEMPRIYSFSLDFSF